jgi:hypothetical protein
MVTLFFVCLILPFIVAWRLSKPPRCEHRFVRKVYSPGAYDEETWWECADCKKQFGWNDKW